MNQEHSKLMICEMLFDPVYSSSYIHIVLSLRAIEMHFSGLRLYNVVFGEAPFSEFTQFIDSRLFVVLVLAVNIPV
jgi:hypothetical protein